MQSSPALGEGQRATSTQLWAFQDKDHIIVVIQNVSWHGQKNGDVSVPAEVIADRNLFFACVPVFISPPVGCPQPLQAHNSHATFDQVQ